MQYPKPQNSNEKPKEIILNLDHLENLVGGGSI